MIRVGVITPIDEPYRADTWRVFLLSQSFTSLTTKIPVFKFA